MKTWPKNKDQIPLFDDSAAFALVPTDGVDGHALLQQRLDQEEAARLQAAAQRTLDLDSK